MFSVRDISKLGVALVITCFALLLWPSYFVFIIAAAIGTAAAFVILYAIVDQHDALRVSWILCTSLLFAYGGGSLSTWLSSGSLQDFAVMTKERPIELLSTTLALVYACCGIMLVVGRFEPPVFSAQTPLPEARSFALVLALLGVALIAIAYLTGDLGYMGIQIDETRRVSVVGATATLVEAPLLGVIGFMIARTHGRPTRLLYIIAASAVIVSVIPSGRRAIVLAMLIVAIGFSLGGGLQRWSLLHKSIFAVLGGLFAYAMSSYFFALRLAGWELGTNAALTDQMWLAFEFVVSPSLQDRFTALFYDNLRERTFMLGYLADLLEATQRSGPLYGETFGFYLRLLVPSILDPSKDQILAYQQVENFIHPKLGLPVIDQANTILTDGMTDFGIVGTFLYFGMITLLLRAVIWAMQKVPAPVTALFGSLAILHLALKPELTMDEYLVPLRNLAWIIPMFWGLESVFSSSKAGHPQRLARNLTTGPAAARTKQN